MFAPDIINVTNTYQLSDKKTCYTGNKAQYNGNQEPGTEMAGHLPILVYHGTDQHPVVPVQ